MAAQVLVVVACLLCGAGRAALINVGQQYLTVMVGGGATSASMQQFGAAFTSPANHQGDAVSPNCVLRHGAADAAAFSFPPSGVSVAPQDISGSAALVSTVVEVAAQLTLPFSVRCVFTPPFNGGVEVQLKQRGTANFTWAGSLSWRHSLTVASGSITISASTMLTPTPLGVAYAYDDATEFLLDPFVSAWVVGKAASLSAEFQAYLDGLSSAYFAPLAQVALSTLSNLESNTTCAAAVVGSKLNLTSGTTCQTGLVPDFPGLPEATIWVVQEVQHARREAAAAGVTVCEACETQVCGMSFPEGYTVSGSGQYCQQKNTGVQADVVDITAVSVA